MKKKTYSQQRIVQSIGNNNKGSFQLISCGGNVHVTQQSSHTDTGEYSVTQQSGHCGTGEYTVTQQVIRTFSQESSLEELIELTEKIENQVSTTTNSSSSSSSSEMEKAFEYINLAKLEAQKEKPHKELILSCLKAALKELE